ncbi:MAG: aminopeptidase, partial [Bacteroidales bacterium]|nr:aminopeptidase [Bacteroidales bacterium]
MAAALVIPVAAQAQPAQQAQTPDLQFTIVKENPITSIKNQNSSGTCWCFSALAFLESEAIRINNIKDKNLYPDFSEMFVVSHSYQDRADKYIRLDGNLTFGSGSE